MSSISNTPVATDKIVQAQEAAAAGLVRINGLPLFPWGNINRRDITMVDPPVSWLGQHCSNNSRFALVTHEGEMYWGHTQCSTAVAELRRDFCGQYGIEPGHVWVPASNGEEFLPTHIYDRLADPFGQPARGHTSAF